MEIKEIIQQRQAKLESLKAKGIAVYPAFSFAHTQIGEELNNFQEGKKVSLCGRIMAKRLHGKVVFLDLKDTTGRIQLYVKADFIGQDSFNTLEELEVGFSEMY